MNVAKDFLDRRWLTMELANLVNVMTGVPNKVVATQQQGSVSVSLELEDCDVMYVTLKDTFLMETTVKVSVLMESI